METNEIMENEEVMNVTEEIVDACNEHGVMIAVGVGLATVLVGGGVFAYKKFGKPVLAKIKAKREEAKAKDTDGMIEIDPVEVDEEFDK